MSLTHTTYHKQHIKYVSLHGQQDIAILQQEIRNFYNTSPNTSCTALQTASYFQFRKNCLACLQAGGNASFAAALPAGLRLNYHNGTVHMQQLVFTLPAQAAPDSDI